MTLVTRDVTNDDHWTDFAHQWLIRPDTTYLNHGSFGPPPQYVKQNRRQWIDKLDSNPMDFYVRQLEPVLEKTRRDLSQFVSTDLENLILVENATFGMNIVANSFDLSPGDEVLINNHEYGAVVRIWQRKCEEAGANLRVARLPEKIESADQVCDCLTAQVNEKTRIAIVSHITSATAIVMPVQQVIPKLKSLGVAVAIDGPHAPAQVDVNLEELGCDFYTASCHKWLSASLGTGFLFVAPRWQNQIRPLIKSWGRLLPAVPERWDEEFTWSGTKDPSAFLSISDAIEYLRNQIGVENFRQRSRHLANYAEKMFCDEFNTTPIADRASGWYASMAHIPFPEKTDCNGLQAMLWDEYRIEVPIINFEDRWYLRVSCHMYNNKTQIDTLKFAIRKFLV